MHLANALNTGYLPNRHRDWLGWPGLSSISRICNKARAVRIQRINENTPRTKYPHPLFLMQNAETFPLHDYPQGRTLQICLQRNAYLVCIPRVTKGIILSSSWRTSSHLVYQVFGSNIPLFLTIPHLALPYVKRGPTEMLTRACLLVVSESNQCRLRQIESHEGISISMELMHVGGILQRRDPRCGKLIQGTFGT